ncbi:helix-turn-helix domain-containing protein [Candidatus Methylocalor cossyra]|uniref:helix-turn-helix domain-containing protein n=1 Tax=Candidatus Methylocalor cossyra TaxID=3108543 RepID=UPI0032B2EF8C
MNQGEVELLERIVRRNRTLDKGTALYRSGEWHHGILALKSGTVKLATLDRQGNEYVVDFLLPGDLLGFDGFASQRHSCSAIALETVSYCELPAHQIDLLTREIPGLLPVLMQHSGTQFDLGIQRLILSRRPAEERLAAFLAHLSERYRQRGFSAVEFRLSMTRQEIGNYLGLAPETVSRLFSQFEESRLIEVRGKLIHVLDMPRLLAFCPS